MKIYNIEDKEFEKYGRIIKDIDVSSLVKLMGSKECPGDTIYVASDPELEADPGAMVFADSVYGQMPTQIGYCNGHNVKLNALEYHRSSEINIMATDAIFLFGMEQDIAPDGTYDAEKIEAFFAPQGSTIEVYATTLHYAPCHADANGFRVIVILPKGTNLELQNPSEKTEEDKMLFAVNKWLIAHPESGIENAFVGIQGENIDISV